MPEAGNEFRFETTAGGRAAVANIAEQASAHAAIAVTYAELGDDCGVADACRRRAACAHSALQDLRGLSMAHAGRGRPTCRS